jgi:hypothetical protein
MRENRDAVIKRAEFLERWAVLTHVPEATAVVADDVSGFGMTLDDHLSKSARLADSYARCPAGSRVLSSTWSHYYY